MIMKFRKKGGFVFTAVVMTIIFLSLSCFSKESVAAMISSHISKTREYRKKEDLVVLKRFLESKIVIQKLNDYGMSKDEAIKKVSQLDEQDLHVLASLVESAPAGEGITITNYWFLFLAIGLVAGVLNLIFKIFS